MSHPVCFETLLATIVLWIALFGLTDCALQRIDAKHHAACYGALLAAEANFLQRGGTGTGMTEMASDGKA